MPANGADNLDTMPLRWSTPLVCVTVYSNGRYCGRRVAVLYGVGELFACRGCHVPAWVPPKRIQAGVEGAVRRWLRPFLFRLPPTAAMGDCGLFQSNKSRSPTHQILSAEQVRQELCESASDGTDGTTKG